MAHSNFKKDLSNEALLAVYLDTLYPIIFQNSAYTTKRITNLELQHQGVDLILSNTKKTYLIDEKAQLDYLNKGLPTFAFELSYLKDNTWHQGWLFDTRKITDIYFLITDIYTAHKELPQNPYKLKITGVYRDKLIKLLYDKGLSQEHLAQLEKDIRLKAKHGKHHIAQLKPKSEGLLYFSKNNKSEQPINLVLKLDFLIHEKVGKVIFEY